MSKLTQVALRRPVSVFLLILAAVVFGLNSLTGMPTELMSDIDMPMLLVQTIYPGADASSVEALVTRKVEDAGESLSGLDSVTSYSYENASMVLFTYEYGTDTNDSYLDMRAALDALANDLPDDCTTPVIMEMSVNAMPTITLSVSAGESADALTFIDENVVPKLESLTGVAQVEVTGGEDNYVRVLLNEEKMSQYGLTMSSVAQFVAAADFTIPAGSVSSGSQDLSVSATNKPSSVEDLRNITLISGRGSLIHLSDVAEVSLAGNAPSSISRYNGAESITVSVTKKQSATTVAVCDRVLKALDSMAGDGVTYQVVNSQADSINTTMRSVITTLLEGVLFTMLVLFIFFGDLRASLIVGSSMPLSLLVTLIILDYTGNSLNVMTGGSLIIAIGMIVDNSIVVLESCFRYRDSRLTFHDAALKGAGTVASSVLASTLTTVVVYLPISLIQGLSGQMFRQLGFTIIYTMVASLISALTVVPLFFTKLKPKAKAELPINRLLALFYRFYDRTIPTVLRHKWITFFVALALFAGSIGVATQLNVELIPSTYDGSISITADFRSGTKLESMDAQIQDMERMLLDDENFDTVTLSISGSTATLTAYSADTSKRTSEEAVTQYTRTLADKVNMDITVDPTSGGGSIMAGVNTSGVEVDLVGTDLDDLRVAAAMVEESMYQTPGVIKVANDFGQETSTLKIKVDPLKAMQVGLTPAGVSMEIYSTLSGSTPSTIVIGDNEYDIKLQYPQGRFDSAQSLRDKQLVTPRGTYTTLGEVAELEYTSSLPSLTRQDSRYQIAIVATAASGAYFDVQKAVTAAVAGMEFPGGVEQSQSMMQSMQSDELSNLLSAILAAVFLVFLVMAMQFESVRFSLMVMMCIPFSLVGSFLMLFLTGTTFSMISLMGFLMLMGIVVNNGILLVDTTNQLRNQMPLREALIEAGKIRLRPILMTTLTTILSMLPMAFSTDDTMSMMQGMAWVIVGGLIASTVMAIFMMPAMYLIIGGKRMADKPTDPSDSLPPAAEPTYGSDELPAAQAEEPGTTKLQLPGETI